MRAAHHLAIALGALALTACSGSEEEGPATLEEAATQKCPRVHMDRMEGDWVVSTGDVKTRLRILPEGEGYKVWYVGGFFSKLELEGVKRDDDLQLTELPRGGRAELIEAGSTEKRRMYLRPVLKTCSLHLEEGWVSADGKETIEPPTKAKEFLPFPDGQKQFTYRPADEAIFFYDAAKDREVAEKQLEDLGGPLFEIEGSSAIPVGMWSRAEADGDASCTYDMDLYFDDQPVPGGQKLPAGEVEDGMRHWYHEWDANWSFNHNFEMYRYRTCEGERELIAVAATEAVLA